MVCVLETTLDSLSLPLLAAGLEPCSPARDFQRIAFSVLGAMTLIVYLSAHEAPIQKTTAFNAFGIGRM